MYWNHLISLYGPEHGMLTIHTNQTVIEPLGEVVRTYDFEWEGGPLMTLSRQILTEYNPSLLRGLPLPEDDSKLCGHRLQLGPYRLFVIGWYNQETLLTRRMNGNWLPWIYSLKVRRLLHLFYSRLLATLVVWNIAEYTPGTLLSWRDIKIYRRLRK